GRPGQLAEPAGRPPRGRRPPRRVSRPPAAGLPRGAGAAVPGGADLPGRRRADGPQRRCGGETLGAGAGPPPADDGGRCMTRTDEYHPADDPAGPDPTDDPRLVAAVREYQAALDAGRPPDR